MNKSENTQILKTEDHRIHLTSGNNIVKMIVNANEEDYSLRDFLRETEEINDIIITNNIGEIVYYFSRFDTLDDVYLKKFKDDFKNIHDCIFNPNKTIPDYGNKIKNLNEYFYSNGIRVLNRVFNITR
jgi:hypothetical protein